jgi:hypothetical protein
MRQLYKVGLWVDVKSEAELLEEDFVVVESTGDKAVTKAKRICRKNHGKDYQDSQLRSFSESDSVDG